MWIIILYTFIIPLGAVVGNKRCTDRYMKKAKIKSRAKTAKRKRKTRRTRPVVVGGGHLDDIKEYVSFFKNLHPDQPIIGFPSVTYNIVNNTTSIGTAVNSPVQQAGQGSTQKGRFVGRVSTRDSAEHIREAVPILRPIVILTATLAALFVVSGVVFLVLGTSGYTEISIFGNSIKSSHVGVICVFLGVLASVLSFRRVLTSLERLGKM